MVFLVFVAGWAGSWKTIQRMGAHLCDYIFEGEGGGMETIDAKVVWIDCCAKFKHSGLNLIDHDTTIHNLLVT